MSKHARIKPLGAHILDMKLETKVNLESKYAIYFLRRHPMTLAGLVVVLISIALIPMAPALAPYQPTLPDATAILQPPSAEHLLGTDNVGMDILSRIIYAPRVDLVIGLTATTISLLLGVPLGVLEGYFDGKRGLAGRLSGWLMRAMDVLQAFPVFILALALLGITGPNIFNIILVLAFLSTPVFMRLVRSSVLSLRERSYIEAARASGNNDLQIVFRHVLPNSLGPVLAQASVTVGWSILLTAGLSFVGAGVRIPTPELGSMVSIGARNMITGHWWPALFPGFAIGVIVLGFALMGDGLREFMDPTKR